MIDYRASLSQLVAGYAHVAVDSDPEVTGLGLDSRSVKTGDAFIALAGQHHHGLEFAHDAARAGCVAILWDGVEDVVTPPIDGLSGMPVIAVPGLARHLGPIASRFYGYPAERLCVLGVTGTNGKSSCVHLLAHALQQSGVNTGVLGTLGYGAVGYEVPADHTTPDAITLQRTLAKMCDDGISHVAMEVSSHALDQGRVGGLGFRAAIFTNLSRDHLDYHADMSAYFEAKARLFARPGLDFAILNADDVRTQALRQRVPCGAMIIDYGIGSGLVSASDLECRRDGLSFDLSSPFGDGRVHARLLGRFNVYNLLAVTACLGALGWSADRIIAHVAKLEPVPGRMNPLVAAHRPLVVIDYAHTPDALEKTLIALRAHARGNLWCVFGCGGDRDRGKRPLMGTVAEAHADRVIVTDDNPRSEDGDRIVQDIVAGTRRPTAVTVLRDRATAIAQAIRMASADDVVLVAGKGHETYQDVAGQRYAFSDRAVVLEACS